MTLQFSFIYELLIFCKQYLTYFQFRVCIITTVFLQKKKLFH